MTHDGAAWAASRLQLMCPACDRTPAFPRMVCGLAMLLAGKLEQGGPNIFSDRPSSGPPLGQSRGDRFHPLTFSSIAQARKEERGVMSGIATREHRNALSTHDSEPPKGQVSWGNSTADLGSGFARQTMSHHIKATWSKKHGQVEVGHCFR